MLVIEVIEQMLLEIGNADDGEAKTAGAGHAGKRDVALRRPCPFAGQLDRAQRRCFGLHHSSFAPDSLTSLAYFSTSALRNAAKSSGVIQFGSAATSARRF